MYRDVTHWTRIRRRLLTRGVSQRQIGRETGISRRTVRKMMEFPIPPGYRRKKPRDRPKLALGAGLIDGIVKEDQGKAKKQRHTARQMWEWLRAEHRFTGGYTIVKDYVRETRCRTGSGSTSRASKSAPNQPALDTEDPAALTYELIQSVPRREAIRLLRVMFGGGRPQVDMERLDHLLAPFAAKETCASARLRAKQSAFDWMRKVLQCEVSFDDLARELGELPGLDDFLTDVAEGRLSVRNRALAVLARERGFSLADVCGFLHLSKKSLLKYCRC
jgi:hypothetical protein